MLWFFSALAGYFFTALSGVIDKFIVSEKIKKPVVFCFLITVFSLVSFVFAPFGLRVLPAQSMAVFLMAGIFFAWGLLFLYHAFKKEEVSRILPLVGIFSALVATVPSFFQAFFFGKIPAMSFFSLIFLLLGIAFLLPRDFNARAFSRKVLGLSFLSGFFFAVFYLLLKAGKQDDINFISGLIWSRVGVFLGGLSMLSVPSYWLDIKEFFFTVSMRRTKKISWSLSRSMKFSLKDISTPVLFIAGKTFGGIGALLIIFATYYGSVATVQALVGVQFLFVFFLATLLSIKFPTIFQERIFSAGWERRLVAFLCISLGAWLAVLGGNTLF